MEILTGAALGLIAGVLVGYGAGRRTERASRAWGATRVAFEGARLLTGQAVGFVLAAALLLACGGMALWVTR